MRDRQMIERIEQSLAWVKQKRRPIAIGLAVIALLWAAAWIAYRFTHSITRDAFVDSHLINVAPQVAGAVVEMRVLEQDEVRKGQVLAVVDPSTYLSRVQAAEAQLALEEEGLRRAGVDLALLEGVVPKRIFIAEQRLWIAREQEAAALDRLDMTAQDTEKSVRAAVHSLRAAQAKLRMAEEDYKRYEALSQAQSVPVRRFQEATRAYHVAQSEVKVAEAKLGIARAGTNEARISKQQLQEARHAVAQATADLELARLGDLEIEAARVLLQEKVRAVEARGRELELARINLEYTQVRAPCDGIIARKWRHAGDYAHAGTPVFSMYDQDLMYVTANLEETLLRGVHPGNRVRLDVVAWDRPFRGRVLWVGSATDSKFSLIPRDVSSGEFTYIVQRVPVRIWIERDERWSRLKPGLSVKATIRHGRGDPAWAGETLLKEAGIERLGDVEP